MTCSKFKESKGGAGRSHQSPPTEGGRGCRYRAPLEGLEVEEEGIDELGVKGPSTLSFSDENIF